MKKVTTFICAIAFAAALSVPSAASAVQQAPGTVDVQSPPPEEAAVNSTTNKANVPMLVTKDDKVNIYVSKISKKISLYKNDQLVNTWNCNVGRNSESGDKKIEGDRRTPSGSFYVCTRNDKSVAYLSLGLSYPSSDDADRGFASGIITEAQRDAIKNAISSGVMPPWNTPLGGAIMIHGNYRETGATRGCVAVANDVMDVLWQYCMLGARVDIGP